MLLSWSSFVVAVPPVVFQVLNKEETYSELREWILKDAPSEMH